MVDRVSGDRCTRSSRHILVTGGCGYIGSHTLLLLLTSEKCSYSVTVLDNLSNASVKVLDRIRQLIEKTETETETETERERHYDEGADETQDDFTDRVRLVQGDIRVMEDVEKAFRGKKKVDAVIHFAGLKAVGTMRK